MSFVQGRSVKSLRATEERRLTAPHYTNEQVCRDRKPLERAARPAQWTDKIEL